MAFKHIVLLPILFTLTACAPSSNKKLRITNSERTAGTASNINLGTINVDSTGSVVDISKVTNSKKCLNLGSLWEQVTKDTQSGVAVPSKTNMSVTNYTSDISISEKNDASKNSDNLPTDIKAKTIDILKDIISNSTVRLQFNVSPGVTNSQASIQQVECKTVKLTNFAELTGEYKIVGFGSSHLQLQDTGLTREVLIKAERSQLAVIGSLILTADKACSVSEIQDKPLVISQTKVYRWESASSSKIQTGRNFVKALSELSSSVSTSVFEQLKLTKSTDKYISLNLIDFFGLTTNTKVVDMVSQSDPDSKDELTPKTPCFPNWMNIESLFNKPAQPSE